MTGSTSRTGGAAVDKTEKASVLRPGHSPVFLPESSSLRRAPRAPGRPRPSAFMERFEDRALFYDCFWHADRQRVLLAGPPPHNLMGQFEDARFTAQPSEAVLTARFHVSRSTMLTELGGAPEGTTHIHLTFDGTEHTIEVQPNLSEELDGARMVFTMNRDNELDWIAGWVRYHALMHQADTFVLFDNGSTRYTLDDLAAQLAPIPAVRRLVLLSWPHRYGATDPAVLMYKFWPLFLQITSMNVVLRRMGARARGILNCDVDELVAPAEDGTVFDLPDRTPEGLARLTGTWVESATTGIQGEVPGHFDFAHVRRDFLRRLSPDKWVLDPKQDWIGALDVFGYMHGVKQAGRNCPAPVEGRFWHFAGINTNWKSQRNAQRRPNPLLHGRDPDLAAAASAYRNALTGAPE